MVYFLSNEEKRYIFRGLLSRVRSSGISSEFRGWSWDNPPLLSPYDDVFISLSEVASRYCLTARDIYLRRVEKIKYFPNKRMVRGIVLHSVVERVITISKRYLYSSGVISGSEFASVMREIVNDEIKKVFDKHLEILRGAGYSDAEVEKLFSMSTNLWFYEINQISAAIDSTLAKHPRISIDSLVNLSIPIVVEQRLDGRFLGLSGDLSADALSFAPVILDLKTGKFREFQKLTTTGYALVLEALYEAPIDVGVLVNLNFDDRNHPVISRKPHIISESLRMEFIEERDKKMEIVVNGADPGVGPSCPNDCPYYSYCHGEDG